MPGFVGSSTTGFPRFPKRTQMQRDREDCLQRPVAHESHVCRHLLTPLRLQYQTASVRIMGAHILVAFEPRKTPIQARSAVTVEAISEATIQVLLSHGERLTTTRIAERAGVSVETLYQYYPNKQRCCLRCSRITWTRSHRQSRPHVRTHATSPCPK